LTRYISKVATCLLFARLLLTDITLFIRLFNLNDRNIKYAIKIMFYTKINITKVHRFKDVVDE